VATDLAPLQLAETVTMTTKRAELADSPPIVKAIVRQTARRPGTAVRETEHHYSRRVNGAFNDTPQTVREVEQKKQKGMPMKNFMLHTEHADAPLGLRNHGVDA
jgi:hypothetical protein